MLKYDDMSAECSLKFCHSINFPAYVDLLLIRHTLDVCGRWVMYKFTALYVSYTYVDIRRNTRQPTGWLCSERVTYFSTYKHHTSKLPATNIGLFQNVYWHIQAFPDDIRTYSGCVSSSVLVQLHIYILGTLRRPWCLHKSDKSDVGYHRLNGDQM